MPAKCGSEEERKEGDLEKVDWLVGAGWVEDGFDGGGRGLELEVRATAHLYLGGQSKAR